MDELIAFGTIEILLKNIMHPSYIYTFSGTNARTEYNIFFYIQYQISDMGYDHQMKTRRY
jgi:hypothetical protein